MVNQFFWFNRWTGPQKTSVFLQPMYCTHSQGFQTPRSTAFFLSVAQLWYPLYCLRVPPGTHETGKKKWENKGKKHQNETKWGAHKAKTPARRKQGIERDARRRTNAVCASAGDSRTASVQLFISTAIYFVQVLLVCACALTSFHLTWQNHVPVSVWRQQPGSNV